MTCNTSAVAVCCSNASRVSVISRAFSIAITACAAKFCKQRDLLVRERPHFLAVDSDYTQERVVLVQRHRNCAADAAGLRHLSETRGRPISLVVLRIGDVDNPFARLDSSQQGSVTVRPDGTTLPDPIAKPRVAVHGTKMKALTIPGSENAEGCLAQPRRLFQHRVEHRSEVAGRAN